MLQNVVVITNDVVIVAHRLHVKVAMYLAHQVMAAYWSNFR